MDVNISLNDTIDTAEVIDIYKANNWSAANVPDKLLQALRASHSLVTARVNGKLVGLGNAISDGYLVVYYPHMLVQPEWQGNGIGRKMMMVLQDKYKHYHQQMLTADTNAIKFYESVGFKKAGATQSMWVYDGKEHS